MSAVDEAVRMLNAAQLQIEAAKVLLVGDAPPPRVIAPSGGCVKCGSTNRVRGGFVDAGPEYCGVCGHEC